MGNFDHDHSFCLRILDHFIWNRYDLVDAVGTSKSKINFTLGTMYTFYHEILHRNEWRFRISQKSISNSFHDHLFSLRILDHIIWNRYDLVDAVGTSESKINFTL